jgi:glycosyltransferase involved in cell wall biosynthesis
MRVALLSHSAPAGDAVGRQIAEKVAFFADRGAEVRVFVSTDRRLHPALHSHTHRFSPAQPRGSHWQFLTAADLITVEYSQHDPMFDLLPLLAGGRSRIVFDYHGVTPPHLGGLNNRDALERGCRLSGLVWTADAAIVHSRFTRQELRAVNNFPDERTTDLGYPLDTAWFSPGPPERPLRRGLGLPDDARLLLFVGRLAPNKRVPCLVEALGRLRDLIPGVHAVILGDGGGAYATERDRCRERAARFDVADRLHFLGHVDESLLRDAYRDANALVIPSVHEGFCIPTVEAMACGLPVIAARAAALPEIIGNAGVTFVADDPDDLARKVRRVLGQSRTGSAVVPKRQVVKTRIAIVAPLFGDGFVGGAETSLRTLARSMADSGNAVEVFTIGTVETSTTLAGLPVHRFRPDPVDADRHAAAAHVLRLSGGTANAEAANDFSQHSLRSRRLVAAIQERGPFDAIVVGPYLLGLTRDIAEVFRERVLLLPCFHDEPFSRLPEFLSAFQSVGGILYHSAEERAFAEADLGLNHPNAHVIGTLLDTDTPGDPRQGRRQVGTGRRYVIYAGRYCQEKALPKLLAFARRYATDFPERFTFAFIGEGEERIPDESWARDLGFVSENARRDIFSGADALVLLSDCESLSLAVLEAQAQGVPVIVRSDAAVLAGHIRRGAGGVAVDGYEAFAAALDDLWADPSHWRALGRAGQNHVRQAFADPVAFGRAWSEALTGLDRPLPEQLLLNGQGRAKMFDRSSWRERFGSIIDGILESTPRPRLDCLEIAPRCATIAAGRQQEFVLLPIRLTNRGQHAEVADGPGRTELVTQVVDAENRPLGRESISALPGLLVPERPVAGIIRVRVPAEPGEYRVVMKSRRFQADGSPVSSPNEKAVPWVQLVVAAESSAILPAALPVNLEPVMRAAAASQELPAGYSDVSEGRFARLKRWAKRKLLHNFQTAYVDVLSRQQSAFNRQVLTALAELGDGQASLAHALSNQSPRSAEQDNDLPAELARLSQANRNLRRRLIRLEASTPGSAGCPEEAVA